jgi:hypothetical protein
VQIQTSETIQFIQWLLQDESIIYSFADETTSLLSTDYNDNAFLPEVGTLPAETSSSTGTELPKLVFISQLDG